MPTAILALGVLLSAFLLGLIFGGPYIQLLRRLRIGANIRREGPSRDFAKQGIPTMGGALFIIVVYRLVARNTIEEKVVALKDAKAQLFASTFDGEALASAALGEARVVLCVTKLKGVPASILSLRRPLGK